MNQSEMTARIRQGDGFIAALDQSGGSTPKALKGYGIEEGAWGNDDLLERARSLGVFGTKERSVINSANMSGISVLVAQQFQVAKQVLAHGLMPIIEPEVNIKSADRAHSDDLLLTAILEELDELPEGQQVMLKLSIPAKAGLFDPLVDQPKVLRVVALSGGFSREEACAEL